METAPSLCNNMQDNRKKSNQFVMQMEGSSWSSFSAITGFGRWKEVYVNLSSLKGTLAGTLATDTYLPLLQRKLHAFHILSHPIKTMTVDKIWIPIKAYSDHASLASQSEIDVLSPNAILHPSPMVCKSCPKQTPRQTSPPTLLVQNNGPLRLRRERKTN